MIQDIKICRKKEEWIQSFEKKVEDYTKTEDFLHSIYKIPDGKDDVYISKRKYISDLDKIIIVPFFIIGVFLRVGLQKIV